MALINDKPMVWWVYSHCSKVSAFDEVYVATDSDEIVDVCVQLGMNVIKTSEDNLTGTDRVAEVAESIDADIYVNVQGDEPLLETETIEKAIRPLIENPEYDVVNLMTKIKDPVDVINFTIPKVITNDEGRGIYLTRSAAPYPKGSLNYSFYKQVCVYAFRPQALSFFKQYGIDKGKTKNESIEDIEILRLIENGYYVHYVEVETNTIAVDTPKDLEKVREYVSLNPEALI